jgi:hypothetical protein
MSPAFPARRRADDFDRLVRGEADASASAELRELADLAAGLSPLAVGVQPRSAFSAELRERLMSAAATELTPAAPSARATTSASADRLTVRRPAGPVRGRRRLTAGIAAVAIIGGTAGTALASQHALPGDALYPVKRALESLHSGVAVGQSSKDRDYLDDAGNRLTEVRELTRRTQVGAGDDSEISATLATFAQQAQQASAALLAQYRSSHDQASLTTLRSFAASSMAQLSELAPVVPSNAKGALSHAAQTLLTIDQSVQQLCGRDCGPVLQLPSSLVQSLATSAQQLATRTLPTASPSAAPSIPAHPQPGASSSPTPHASSGTSGSSGGRSTAPQTSTAPGKTTAPLGGGAGDLSKGPSQLDSAVGGLVSKAASGVSSAVGGLVGGLLGGQQ